jgi:hypothetical protein
MYCSLSRLITDSVSCKELTTDLCCCFLELVLKQEQEEYSREGIEWKNIDFFNNQIICDLVEQPHKGVFAIMDEACLNVGKVTDEVLFTPYYFIIRYFRLCEKTLNSLIIKGLRTDLKLIQLICGHRNYVK